MTTTKSKLLIHATIFPNSYSVFHVDYTDPIGGYFADSNGTIHYSSLITRKELITDNQEQGLKFIEQSYMKHKPLVVETKSNQINLFL